MKRKAFTILELLVVVIVLSVLIGLAFVAYSSYVEKSKSGEALINIDAIKKGEEAYKLSNGAYVNADNADSINALLSIQILPKYYEYRVVGATAYNFLVIAKRIGEDIDSSLAAGIIPSDVAVMAMDNAGAVSNASLFATTGGLGSGGGGTATTGGWGGLGGITAWVGGPGGGTGGAGGGTGGTGGTGGIGGLGIPPYTGGGSFSYTLPGVVYNATTDEAMSLLGSESGMPLRYVSSSGESLEAGTVQHYLDLINDEHINISWADLGYSITSDGWFSMIAGYWVDGSGTITLNSAMQTLPGFPPEVVATTILHEATHADYFYNSNTWENRIETMWPDVKATVDAAIAKGEPDPLRNPNFPGNPLVYTQTDEYFAHMDEAQLWGQYMDKYSGVQGVGIDIENDLYNTAQLGEASMRAYIGAIPYYAELPEFYYDPNNPSDNPNLSQKS